MYIVEVYKKDQRTKEGERLVCKVDHSTIDRSVMAEFQKRYPKSAGYRFLIHETWVMRKNMITDSWFRERYDTPRHCSPSSETYWSM